MSEHTSYADRYAGVIPAWFASWLPVYRKYGFEAGDVHQEAALALLQNEHYLADAEWRTKEDPVRLARVVARRAVKRKLLMRSIKELNILITGDDPLGFEDKRDALDVRVMIADLIHDAPGDIAARLENYYFGGPGASPPTPGDNLWVVGYLKEKCQ